MKKLMILAILFIATSAFAEPVVSGVTVSDFPGEISSTGIHFYENHSCIVANGYYHRTGVKAYLQPKLYPKGEIPDYWEIEFKFHQLPEGVDLEHHRRGLFSAAVKLDGYTHPIMSANWRRIIGESNFRAPPVKPISIRGKKGIELIVPKTYGDKQVFVRIKMHGKGLNVE